MPSQTDTRDVSLPRDRLRRSTTASGRGRRRGVGATRLSSGPNSRALPDNADSVAELDSVSAMLAPSSPVALAVNATQVAANVPPTDGPRRSGANVVGAARLRWADDPSTAGAPQDEPLSSPPSLPASPKQESTTSDYVTHSEVKQEGITGTAPAPTAPSQSTTLRASPSTMAKTPPHDRKGKQKRKGGSTSTPGSPSSQGMSPEPQEKIMKKKKAKLDLINSTFSAPAGLSTAPVQPYEFFETSASGVSMEGLSNPALFAAPVPNAPTASGPSFGQADSTRLADTHVPSLARAPRAQEQLHAGWDISAAAEMLLPEQKQLLRYMIMGQAQPLQPLATDLGGGLNVPLTAPPVLGTGTFAQEQALPPIMANSPFPAVPTPQTVIGSPVTDNAGTNQIFDNAMPQTAFPILQGHEYPQWNVQPRYGSYYLPSYNEMLSNPAMLANPNLAPWTAIAARHTADRGQNQHPHPTKQSFVPNSSGLEPTSLASANPQPAFQHCDPHSSQIGEDPNVLDILNNPDLGAEFDYIGSLATENLVPFTTGPAASGEQAEQVEGTEPTSMEVQRHVLQTEYDSEHAFISSQVAL